MKEKRHTHAEREKEWADFRLMCMFVFIFNDSLVVILGICMSARSKNNGFGAESNMQSQLTIVVILPIFCFIFLYVLRLTALKMPKAGLTCQLEQANTVYIILWSSVEISMVRLRISSTYNFFFVKFKNCLLIAYEIGHCWWLK